MHQTLTQAWSSNLPQNLINSAFIELDKMAFYGLRNGNSGYQGRNLDSRLIAKRFPWGLESDL